ncbi:AAA family ATPase [Pseudomonas sp. NPDC087697]|uniref:AAA family ATPase n=1 Tax=Pseudomonas sp. NPDC087697 TaxID=3364447 RepID=UPI00380BC789
MTSPSNTPSAVAQAWAKAANTAGGWHPLNALTLASETRWLVDGVIPAASIVWVTGKPACGKTFTMMDMAACVSSGRRWQGRQCDQALVIYVAAEGGTDIHIRRAAAELAAGVTGSLLIVQARPRIDEAEGLAELMSLVQEATGEGIRFEHVTKVSDAVRDFEQSLKPEELAKYQRAERYENLSYWVEEGNSLDVDDASELRRLERELTPEEKKWGENKRNDWGFALAESRLSPIDKAAFKYNGLVDAPADMDSRKVLLIIDTFSQTAADDSKPVVSRYMKNLRELVEQSGDKVSVVVVDHLTKSGDSYMGSLAKQGDTDAMIEIERKGQLVTVTCPEKMKAAKPFDPIHLELVEYTIGDHSDAQGRPLTSLIMQDGERVHRLRKAAGASTETAATIVLELLADDSPCDQESLRAKFSSHSSNAGKKADTVRRAFSRAIESLSDDEVIQQTGDVVSFSLISSLPPA